MKHTIKMSTVEALIVLRALRLSIDNKHTHPTDKKMAQELLYRIRTKCTDDMGGAEDELL